MTLTKDQLEKKYLSMHNEDLSAELNVSMPTLLKLIDDAGIDRKGSGNAYNRQHVKIVD